MYRLIPAVVLVLTLVVSALPAQSPVEKLDYETIAKIRDEGLTRSQVMDHISWLSDVYGPRLTGSPAILQASDWVLKKFNEWGLTNEHRETWRFGKGWSLVRFSAHLIEPQVQPLIGFPGSWTPGTKGTITADVVRVQIDGDADFEKYRGQLAGKIVLTQSERAVPMLEGLIVHRMGDKDFAEAATTPAPRGRGRGATTSADDTAAAGRGRGAAQAFIVKVNQFLKAEGAVAVFNRGSDSIMASVGSDLSTEQQHTDGGTIFPTGNGSRGADAGSGLPTVTLAIEHYNRMVRILAKGIPVKVELNIETKFYDETTPNGFNTIAEIPGTDPKL
jgi:carboxypeptidase Q